MPRNPAPLAPDLPFLGFSPKARRFFKALGRAQDREWFIPRKAEYEELWQRPLEALLDEVRLRLSDAFPDLAPTKVFRIQRDVRFSADKRPYKTHCAGVLHVGSPARQPTMAPAALYAHFGDEDYAGAGEYAFEGASLISYREALVHPRAGAEIAKIVTRLEKRGFAIEAMSELKKVPPGFDADHPNAALLRKKGLIASFPAIPRKLTESPKLAAWLADRAKETAPLVQWLVRHIDHSGRHDGRR